MVGRYVQTKVCSTEGCGLNYVPMYEGDPVCDFCHRDAQEQESGRMARLARSQAYAEWADKDPEKLKRRKRAYYQKVGRYRRAEAAVVIKAVRNMEEAQRDRAWVFRYVGPPHKAHALAFYSLVAMVTPAGYAVAGIVDRGGVFTPAQEGK